MFGPCFRYKDANRIVKDDRVELDVQKELKMVTFKISETHLEDTAKYTLVAHNGIKKASKTITLYIEGNLNVFL